MKKWQLFLTTVMLGLIVCQVQAIELDPTFWQVGTGNWSTEANWYYGEPTGSHAAYINNGGTAQITQAGEA